MAPERDLVDTDDPANRSFVVDMQWNRIGAFVTAVAIVALYFWLDLFGQLPDWLAAGFTAVPVGLLLYSVSSLPWKTIAFIAIGTAIGLGFGTYLDTSGFDLPW